LTGDIDFGIIYEMEDFEKCQQENMT